MAKGTCSIDGCEKPAATRGWCCGHYRRVWLTGDVRADKPLVPHAGKGKRPPCIAPDCETVAAANKMCTLHNQRWYVHQSFDLPEWTPKTDFRHGTPQGYNFHKCRCEACTGWAKAYRAANADRDGPQKRRLQLARYGLTPAEFEAMAAAQGYRCAVCRMPQPDGRRRNLCVDHDHATGVVRGLLCGLCNTAAGQLQDDPALADALAAYLRNPVAAAVR